MKKKPKDINPGDIVIDFGIVTEIDATYDDPFWEKPHCTYLAEKDPYYGRVSGPINPNKEYEIITNPQQIRKIYQKVDKELVKYIEDRKAERELLKSFQGGCS